MSHHYCNHCLSKETCQISFVAHARFVSSFARYWLQIARCPRRLFGTYFKLTRGCWVWRFSFRFAFVLVFRYVFFLTGQLLSWTGLGRGALNSLWTPRRIRHRPWIIIIYCIFSSVLANASPVNARPLITGNLNSPEETCTNGKRTVCLYPARISKHGNWNVGN